MTWWFFFFFPPSFRRSQSFVSLPRMVRSRNRKQQQMCTHAERTHKHEWAILMLGSHEIPHEVATEMLSVLDVKTLAAACLVSHAWHSLASSPSLWFRHKKRCVECARVVSWFERMFFRLPYRFFVSCGSRFYEVSHQGKLCMVAASVGLWPDIHYAAM